MAKLILGLDLGTTSVKCSIIDSQSCQILSQQNQDTHAGEGEQNVMEIINAVQKCLHLLPKEQLQRVQRIGVCGQMHGVVLWKAQTTERWTPELAGLKEDDVSPLFTWQDDKCTKDFLDTLPKPDSHLRYNIIHIYFTSAS